MHPPGPLLQRVRPALLSSLLLGACASACATSLGLNSFNLVQQYLGVASGGDGTDRYREVTRAMAERAIADAQDAQARFLRVAAAGYAPSAPGLRSDLDLWLHQPERHWAAMDAMVDELGRHHLRLVLTLLWNIRQFPAMTHESVRDLIVNPESASSRLAARYITELVGRYAGRREILFYEVANELNLQADLDQVSRCNRGGKATADCSVEGNFSTAEMITFAQRIQRIVRSTDPQARIASGYSAPRRAAEHIRAQPEWITGRADFHADTLQQFEKNLADIHAGYDIVSVHVYPTVENARFGSNDPQNLDTVDAAMKVARATGKQLYVGEFGDSDGRSDAPDSFTSRMFQHIAEVKPDYASPWVWEFYQTSTFRTRDTADSRFSLEPGVTDATIARFRTLSQALSPGTSPPTLPPAPRVVLTWPLRCALVMQPETAAAVASAQAGIRSVQFYIDDHLLAQRNAWPYTANLEPERVSAGAHVLHALVTDNEGRQSDSAVPVSFGRPVTSPECPQVAHQKQ